MLIAQQKQREQFRSDFFTWTRAVWTTSRGNQLEFHNRFYLIDLYRDQHPNIVFTKAAQMGLSERLLAEAVWIPDQLSKNVLYTFPTQSHLQDFVQARLDPVLANSDYFISRIEKVDGVKDISKIGLKRVGKGFIYLRGSQNEKQIITIDADAVFLDERDRFIQQNVPFIDKRTLASTLKWRREASTPTIPGLGIHEAYLNSDQRIWELECQDCGKWQDLDWFQNVDFEKEITICKFCKKELNRLQDGRWRAQKDSTVHGYKIPGLLNPNRTVGELIESYNKAKIAGFADLQQFFNQVLGEPYEIAGQSLSITEIDNCKRNYYIPVQEATNCYAGVDVGVQKHHVVILQKLSQDEMRVVWAGTVSDFFGPVDSIESILRKYDIKLLVIDKRPETSKVKDLINMFPKEVFACEYSNTKFEVTEYAKWDDIKHELMLDRTVSIDYLISDIQNQRTQLPQNITTIPDFYDQLRSSVRITEKNPKTGIEVSRWVEKAADHFLHAFNYARMAQTRGVLGEALLNYYAKPAQAQSSPDFLDWLRVNGQRLERL